MYFFQDDIGLLIQLHNIPFFTFLFTPQAEHFAPILHLIIGLEYRFFGLNYTLYILVAMIGHVINCFLLGKIVHKMFNDRFCTFLVTMFFLINLTYFEPILWFAAHGIILSTFLIGLAFYYWYEYITSSNSKYLLFSVTSTLLAGFSFGNGIAVGLMFALVTLIFKDKLSKKDTYKTSVIYFSTAIFSYSIGPVISHEKLGRIIPLSMSSLRDFGTYAGFIIVGVSRGVVGRFFLPGFEPRHFQIFQTAISFAPFIFVVFLSIKILISKSKHSSKLLIIIISLFITYPYIWAGFIRSNFGLKQALAERYAYTPFFFFSILLILIIKTLFKNKQFIFHKQLIAITFLYTILQSIFFVRNTVSFEIKPMKTKEYINKLTQVLNDSVWVLDLPLPSYINQEEFRISDVSDLVSHKKMPIFIRPKTEFCHEEFMKEIVKPDIYSFYIEQSNDKFVGKELSTQKLVDCLIKINKTI